MRLGFLFMYNNVISPPAISPAGCGDSRCLGIHPTLCSKCTTPLFPIKDFIYDAPSCRQRSFTSLTEDTSGSQKNPLGMSTVMLQPCARWLGENQDLSYNSTLGKGWDCWELLPGALHSPSTHSIPGNGLDGSLCALECARRGTGCSELLIPVLGAAGAQLRAFQVLFLLAAGPLCSLGGEEMADFK